MGDMPTNKASTSDNAQKQSASNAVPIFYSVFLIFQTSKRYDFNSVWACVSHAATCHDNHQVGLAQRHLLFCLVMLQNESFNFQKMFGLCLFPYSQHICSTLTQMACLITVCISRGLNAYVVKSRMFS